MMNWKEGGKKKPGPLPEVAEKHAREDTRSRCLGSGTQSSDWKLQSWITDREQTIQGAREHQHLGSMVQGLSAHMSHEENN